MMTRCVAALIGSVFAIAAVAVVVLGTVIAMVGGGGLNTATFPPA